MYKLVFNTVRNPVWILPVLLGGSPSLAQEAASPLQVTVNSSQDGEIEADEQMTLREAISLQNGTLLPSDLTAAEQAQIQPANQRKIAFNLPTGETTIQLQSVLPALESPDLYIDGTTQPGYSNAPIVALTPTAGTEVFRGLTVVADNVTVKGLSLYGFTSIHRQTATTPPADIFIAHQLPPPDISQQKRPGRSFPFRDRDRPPIGVVIADNWLGLTPEGTKPVQPSAFGVSVFNSQGATIKNNRIAYHDGSGIITSVRAENLEISDNQIVANGLAGMPDAIRLEGVINKGVIRNNLICGNDGSGIFMFKPDGAVEIYDNNIKLNGQRLKRAAVYLMGNDHQVRNNQIHHQSGPGVVVAAYPKSDRNIITNNTFSHLDGLSIDLISRRSVGVTDYQRGDGANMPQRDTGNRRRDTANRAINTPVFLSQEFIRFDDQVNIDGVADPGAVVTLYKVVEGNDVYGPLSEPLMDITADDEGRFSATLEGLQAGDRISAIATQLEAGTSEPAQNASIQSLESATVAPSTVSEAAPSCTP
ncbi:MAG: right-handed parallel beta-helix repeat-containing protein [Cyanobacteria bacterium P01_A01_bin.17]